MGSVYLAEGEGGAEVAAKVISEAALRDDTASRRMVREARTALSVHDRNVVRTIEAGNDEATGLPYIILELLSGADLSALLAKERALPPTLAARIFCQAARGLAAAHAKGVVHRDIKPANLFLHCGPSDEIVVKVCDFGIAKQLGGELDQSSKELTRTGGLLGSPSYLSPEQAKNAKTVGPASDLWSLGVSMWEALSGHRMWANQTSLGELILAICTSTIPRLEQVAPWVPAELGAVVNKCLERDVALRWKSADDMLRALEPFTAGSERIDARDLRGVDPKLLVAFDRTVLSDDSGRPSSPSGEASAVSTLGHSAHELAAESRARRGRAWVLAAIAGVTLAIGSVLFVRGGAISSSSTLPSAGAVVAPTVKSALLAVQPASASVRVDGKPAIVTDGNVRLQGTPGQSFEISIGDQGRETSARVVMSSDGTLAPSRVTLPAEPAAVAPSASAAPTTKPPKPGAAKIDAKSKPPTPAGTATGIVPKEDW